MILGAILIIFWGLYLILGDRGGATIVVDKWGVVVVGGGLVGE